MAAWFRTSEFQLTMLTTYTITYAPTSSVVRSMHWALGIRTRTPIFQSSGEHSIDLWVSSSLCRLHIVLRLMECVKAIKNVTQLLKGCISNGQSD
jgi:hypothetical protein